MTTAVNIQFMVGKVPTMSSVADVLQVLSNAEQRGADILIRVCVEQVAKLAPQASNAEHPLVKAFWEIIPASEAIQKLRHQRTRNEVKAKTAAGSPQLDVVKEILTRWSHQPADIYGKDHGFGKLAAMGLPHLTGEWLVAVKFSGEFPAETVAAARAKLAAAGIAFPA
jgi:hypothetical protein